MCRTISEGFRKERILSVMLDLGGLCVELGDEDIDNEVYGYGPTQNFIKAVAKEIRFQIRNTGGLGEHSTLRRVRRRFQQGVEKRRQICGCAQALNESPTTKSALVSLPEDPHLALEEVRNLLGLSENQLDFLLALLWKADDGHLDFHVGNVYVEFFNSSFDEKEIVFDIRVEKGNTTHSVKYVLKTQPKDLEANDVDVE